MTETERIRLREQDAKLVDLSNLIDALDLLAWELVSQNLTQGSEADKLRNAIIGIAQAMKVRAA